ncbi:hypothetical protein [Verrucosispora sioxanthis]|uniref:hypothetical protein n=1 Tax=Verrucosispora sioxanthis TaxID=2499994 RepID=UPI001C10A438|nr:hypothetical protein [Verrucosispora sioxanthis]
MPPRTAAPTNSPTREPVRLAPAPATMMAVDAGAADGVLRLRSDLAGAVGCSAASRKRGCRHRRRCCRPAPDD